MGLAASSRLRDRCDHLSTLPPPDALARGCHQARGHCEVARQAWARSEASTSSVGPQRSAPTRVPERMRAAATAALSRAELHLHCPLLPPACLDPTHRPSRIAIFDRPESRRASDSTDLASGFGGDLRRFRSSNFLAAIAMLRVYGRYLGVLRQLRPVLTAIERRDVDLARQMRRAASSVALNMCEGCGCEGGTRRQRYLSALGSRERPSGVSRSPRRSGMRCRRRRSWRSSGSSWARSWCWWLPG